jgi:predicted esterase
MSEPRPTMVRTLAARVHGTYLLVAPNAPDLPAGGRGGVPLLVGFHGYGENAERHLAELRRVPGSERWALAAVQALHPFYNSKTGEVVASWMTKHDREHAIADNVRWVSNVVTELRRELGGGEAAGPLVYAGFSQGVAMAWRGAAAADHPCQGLVAVGGDVPPDLADRDLSPLRVLIGRGTRDTWYDEDKMARDLALLTARGAQARPVLYEGGHEWTDEIRQAAGTFLAEILAG